MTFTDKIIFTEIDTDFERLPNDDDNRLLCLFIEALTIATQQTDWSEKSLMDYITQAKEEGKKRPVNWRLLTEEERVQYQ